MAGKRRHLVKKNKKKIVKKSKKKQQRQDLKQTTLSFARVKEEDVSLEVSTSSGSVTVEIQRQFSHTNLSPGSSSSSRKRTCSEKGGPSAKKHAEDSCLDYITEEESSSEGEQQYAMSIDSDFFDEAENKSDEELENSEFIRYQQELGKAIKADSSTKPPELDEKLCKGVGDPSEIWNLMCKKDEMERIKLQWLQVAIAPTTRSVLVDWMMEVCEQEKQHRATFHLAVNYMDRFLAVHQEMSRKTDQPAVSVNQLQCIGTVCLLLASKYEEIYPPRLESFVEYTDGACDRKEVEQQEKLILHRLDWGLSVMTSVQWLATFFQIMGKQKMEKEDSHYSEKPLTLPKVVREQYMTMAKTLDVCILDMGHLKFSYRELAAAVIFLSIEPYSFVEKTTGYSYEQIQPAMDWVGACQKYALSIQQAGDPLPNVSDISSEEWHDIQTHPVAFAEAYDKISAERIMMENRRRVERLACRRPVKRSSRLHLRPTNEQPS